MAKPRNNKSPNVIRVSKINLCNEHNLGTDKSIHFYYSITNLTATNKNSNGIGLSKNIINL